MSAVRHEDVLFRAGGVCLQKYGRPWWRGPYDRNEPDTYTFTRADSTTCSTIVDADLTIRTAAAGKLRCSWYDTDSDGVADVCGLLLESSRANLCLQSEDLATTWSDIGTPTLSAGALTCGVLSLALLGDDSGAAAEGKRQTFAGGTMTGDAVKALSVFVSKGTSAAAGGSVIQFTDTSAVADRLYATVTWNGTVPSVAMATGTLMRTVRLASNIYRLEFQTTSVTAANAHRIDLYPATTAAQTGNLYVGGVMLENGAYPSSYIKTTTVAVTRAADALSFPIGFPPQDLTMYVKIVPPWGTVAGSDVGAVLGGIVGSGGGQLQIVHVDGTDTYRAQINNSASSETCAAVPATNPAAPTMVVQILNATTLPQCRMDAGGGFGAYSTALTASMGRWISDVATVAAPTLNEGLLVDVIVARGAFTLAEMAAAPTP